MRNIKTDNLRIASLKEVIVPSALHQQFPMTEYTADLVTRTRQDIHRILQGEDDRLLVVVGPCSVHDPLAALEYAVKLATAGQEYGGQLLLVMRTYFEKPRTTVGWKGLINDPDLDGSFNNDKGLSVARRLLLNINELGVPAGTEYLDPISPQYISDLVSWGAIGARTTESQVHRELVSGLSCPVGLKNGTTGALKAAIDAIGAASQPHSFLGVTYEGSAAIFNTRGNRDCHIILRGGVEPNYSTMDVSRAVAELTRVGQLPRVMIDFSHANSRKQYQRQLEVGADVANQIGAGSAHIIGVMIESHLRAGSQKVVSGQPLTYGQSITDACLGWDDTCLLLDQLASAIEHRRQCVPVAAAQ